VPSAHHPRRAIQNGPEVVVAARFGFTGGDPHPYRQLHVQLGVDGRGDRGTGGAEDPTDDDAREL
jgi:hypothetical protein